jgi:formate--tetrahydrofolate ligase
MTDQEVARTIKLKPIGEIAAKLGIDADDLELYGKYKAKLPLKYIDSFK